ncbi:hypothetical protein JCM6882_003376 [Rhodosporidiobolus microsporus]
MPLWLRAPRTWPSTLEEALERASEYGMSEEHLQLVGTRVPDSRQSAWIQSYAARAWNSRFVPAWFNSVLYQTVVLVIFICLAQRAISPHVAGQLPSYRRLQTFVVKYIVLAPLFGSNSLATTFVLPAKTRLAHCATLQVPRRVDFFFLSLYIFGTSAVLLTDFSPLLILLAARNSPLEWLASLNFGRRQLYHRWVARVTFLNVGLHVTAYSWIHLQHPGRGIETLFNKPYLLCGWLAFLGGTVLCLASWRRLRQIAYEAFLVGHVLAALVWLVGAYLHVFLRLGANHDPYNVRLCYLAASAWAFDRVLRLISLIWNNTLLGRLFAFPSVATVSSKTRFLAAEGVLVGTSGNFLRLRITPTTPWDRPRGGPGAYVFISSFTTSGHKAWESHPFSIAWPLGVPDADALDCTSDMSWRVRPGEERRQTVGGEASKQPAHFSVCTSRTPLEPSFFDLPPSANSFELVIKKHSGFTHLLASSLSLPVASPSRFSSDEPPDRSLHPVHPLRLAIEGPYGATPAHVVARYRQALLLAGGSGVAMVTSQLADLGVLVTRRSEGSKVSLEIVKTERVVVVWVIREADTIHLLAPYLRRLHTLFRSTSHPSCTPQPPFCASTPPPAFIALHIYITDLTNPSLEPTKSALAALSLPPSFLQHTVQSGRPDFGAHIDALSYPAPLTESPTLREGGRELLVVSCGPAALADSAREAVRSRLRGWRCGAAQEGVERDAGGAEAGERQRLVPRSHGGRSGRASRWEADELVYSEEAVLW